MNIRGVNGTGINLNKKTEKIEIPKKYKSTFKINLPVFLSIFGDEFIKQRYLKI